MQLSTMWTTRASVRLQILRRRGMWYETWLRDTARNLGGLQEPQRLADAKCEDVRPTPSLLSGQPHSCIAPQRPEDVWLAAEWRSQC